MIQGKRSRRSLRTSGERNRRPLVRRAIRLWSMYMVAAQGMGSVSTDVTLQVVNGRGGLPECAPWNTESR